MESSKFKTKTIKQTVTFKASPHDVYEALMDSASIQSSQEPKPKSAARSVESSLPTMDI